ncbi:MAG: DNA recombination/repair protein RecA, partial [Chloroflexota bacterium]
MPQNDKSKTLESTIANIHKRFGDDAIMRLGDAHNLNVDVVPSGSLSLDIALGVG